MVRLNVMRCDTVRGAQEFLFNKSGYKVFFFDPYLYAASRAQKNNLLSHLFPIKHII